MSIFFTDYQLKEMSEKEVRCVYLIAVGIAVAIIVALVFYLGYQYGYYRALKDFLAYKGIR